MRHLCKILLGLGIALLCGSPLRMPAQQKAIDSLRLAVATAPNDTTKVLLIADLAYYLNKSGGENPLQLLTMGSKLAQQLKFKRGMALIWVQMGTFWQKQGKYKEAEEYYLRALHTRRELGDSSGVTNIYGNLGILKRKQGDLLGARQLLENALRIHQKMGDSASVARMCNQLANLNRTLGDYRLALQYGLRSLQINQNAAPLDSLEIGKSYMVLGNIHEYMAQNDRADSMYNLAKTCFERNGNQRELANALTSLGNVQEFNGNYEAALTYYNLSRKQRATMTDTIDFVNNLQNIAQVQIFLRRFDNAEATLREAAALLTHSQDMRHRILIEAKLAELYLWQGNPKKAIPLLRAVLPHMDSLAEFSQRLYYNDILAIAQAGVQEFDSSLQWHVRAMQLRHIMDININASLYQYDRYLQSVAERDRAIAESTSFKSDLEIQKERSRTLRVIIVAFVILLFAVIFVALQRNQMLQSKRRTAESLLALEQKEREVERLEQSKKLEHLQIAAEVEDRERSRIAQDLHDTVGAQLGALKLLFGQLREDLESRAAVAGQSLERINLELQVLMKDVRYVAYDLSQPSLKQFGLAAAIMDFKQMFDADRKLEFELDIRGLEQRLDARIEKSIYLAIKELFNNATRHGEATMFSIQTFRDKNIFTVMIEDNGKGYDPTHPNFKPGIGLQSIYNRVEMMHGKIIIDSALGRGTIVTIEIPVNEITI